MKDLLFSMLAICALMAVVLAGVGENPPTMIERAFRAKFKKASKVAWRSTYCGYIASFFLNGVKKQAIYSKGGKLLSILSAISPNELPLNAMAHFGNCFPGQSISETFVMIKADGRRQYVVASDALKAIYSEDGEFVKMEHNCKKELAGAKAPKQKAKLPYQS
jgi:hypothetical protein